MTRNFPNVLEKVSSEILRLSRTEPSRVAVGGGGGLISDSFQEEEFSGQQVLDKEKTGGRDGGWKSEGPSEMWGGAEEQQPHWTVGRPSGYFCIIYVRAP